jgi:hypothetical protein
MPRDPDLVYIPVVLLDDRRLSARDQATLMLLIALADNPARCDYDEDALAHLLGVTIRTTRKWLARLKDFGYIINHKDWVELHDDLILTQDSLLMADLPPLSDEQFARLQLADDPDEFLKQYATVRRGARPQEALSRPAPRPHRGTPPPQAILRGRGMGSRSTAAPVKSPRARGPGTGVDGSATTRETCRAGD